jgi:hypothetical protein
MWRWHLIYANYAHYSCRCFCVRDAHLSLCSLYGAADPSFDQLRLYLLVVVVVVWIIAQNGTNRSGCFAMYIDCLLCDQSIKPIALPMRLSTTWCLESLWPLRVWQESAFVSPTTRWLAFRASRSSDSARSGIRMAGGQS